MDIINGIFQVMGHSPKENHLDTPYQKIRRSEAYESLKNKFKNPEAYSVPVFTMNDIFEVVGLYSIGSNQELDFGKCLDLTSKHNVQNGYVEKLREVSLKIHDFPLKKLQEIELYTKNIPEDGFVLCQSSNKLRLKVDEEGKPYFHLIDSGIIDNETVIKLFEETGVPFKIESSNKTHLQPFG